MPIAAAPANGAAPASPTIASFCASYDRITAAAADLRRQHAALAADCVHWIDGSTHQPYFPLASAANRGSLPSTASRAFDDATSTSLSRYSQRALMAVVNDTEWLRLHRLCHDFDRNNPNAIVPHREATRLISCSQEGSGAFVARLPDTTLPGSAISSSAFLVILQRRIGLHLTALKSTLDARAAAGHAVTEYHRLGDADINSSNKTARHNAALNATFHALKAVTPPDTPPHPCRALRPRPSESAG